MKSTKRKTQTRKAAAKTQPTDMHERARATLMRFMDREPSESHINEVMERMIEADVKERKKSEMEASGMIEITGSDEMPNGLALWLKPGGALVRFENGKEFPCTLLESVEVFRRVFIDSPSSRWEDAGVNGWLDSIRSALTTKAK